MPIFYMPRAAAYALYIQKFSGSSLYFYEAGTSTPKTTYSDYTETTPHDFPVAADSNGVWPAVYLTGTFKVVVTDSDGVTVFTEDNLSSLEGQLTLLGDFDSSTNSGDYPATGYLGATYRVVESFQLSAASGSHRVYVGDYIISNTSNPTGIDADWDILRGVDNDQVIGPEGTGAASAGVFSLMTAETTIVSGDFLGKLEFKAPFEASGGDAIISGAAIWGVSEDIFTGSVNSTAIVFGVAQSGAAAEVARFKSDGDLSLQNNIILETGGSITSAANNISITPFSGSSVILDSHFSFDGAILTALTDNNTVISAFAGKNITIESITFDGLVIAPTSGTIAINSAVTVNETGADVDFRVEGDTDQNLLFVDASANMVGIGTNSPSSALTVFSTTAPKLTIGGTAANTSDRSIEFESSAGSTAGLITLTPNTVSTDSILRFYVGGSSGTDIKLSVDDLGDIIAAGSLFIGDTANSFMTQGLTINQGANDNETIALKSSDVAHGMTNLSETDTYLDAMKFSATGGGVLFRGFSELSVGIGNYGMTTTPSTLNTSSAVGCITIGGYKQSGATVTSLTDTENIFCATNAGTTKFIIKGDGTHINLGGVLALAETTTPTALANYGKIYTKSDNILYFQDGAGAEHAMLYSGMTAAILIITSADINGGTIDGTIIGENARSGGYFSEIGIGVGSEVGTNQLFIDNEGEINTYPILIKDFAMSDGDYLRMNARGQKSGGSALREAQIGVYYNSSSTSNEPSGYILLNTSSGSANYMWVDDTGDLRISTTLSHIGTTSGTVVGTQT